MPSEVIKAWWAKLCGHSWEADHVAASRRHCHRCFAGDNLHLLLIIILSTIHREVVNEDIHFYWNSDKTKNLKETNSETFWYYFFVQNRFWDLFGTNLVVGRLAAGINVQVVPIFPFPLLAPAAASTALLGPTFGLLQVQPSFKIQNVHSHIYLCISHVSPLPRRAPQVRSFLDFCSSCFPLLAPPPLEFSKEQYLGE